MKMKGQELDHQHIESAVISKAAVIPYSRPRLGRPSVLIGVFFFHSPNGPNSSTGEASEGHTSLLVYTYIYSPIKILFSREFF